MPFNRIESGISGRTILKTEVRAGYHEKLKKSDIKIIIGEDGKDQIIVTTTPVGDPIQPIAEFNIFSEGQVNQAKIKGRIPGKLRRVRFKDISSSK